ncbi:MAG TPA: NAD(+) kinase [Blastocatellia bacterium]|nr:NAD(+) kinase [Blastocatellia bacterium]
MRINTCAVVIKQTALATGGRATQFARQGDLTARRIIRADAEHRRTAEAVRLALARRQIAFTELSLQRLTAAAKRRLTEADLVITVGGDGTALGSSHYVRRGALVGVNSAPGDSVGHFCRCFRNDFARRLDDILESRWHPTRLARLAIALDGRTLPELALNDVLIAHDSPAATTRYLITVGEHTEEQRSSGLWVATAAGSTAGIHSAGGRVVPLGSRRLQYLVRELYREPGRAYQLLRGFIEPGEEIVIASKMPQAHLYIDGAKTAYPFPFGARAGIRLADSALRIFLSSPENRPA